MTTSTPTTAGAALSALAERFWDEYLATYPTWATVIGDRRFDDRLEDPSPDAIRRRIDWLDGVAAEARTVAAGELSSMEQVTRQMLIDETTGQAAGLRTGMHEWTVDPLQGPTVSLLDLVDYQPIRTPDEGRAMVARWREIGPYLDRLGASLREAAADGLVAVTNPVERTLDVLDRLEALPPEDWKLSGPANVEHDDWSDRDLARFRDDLVSTVR